MYQIVLMWFIVINVLQIVEDSWPLVFPYSALLPLTPIIYHILWPIILQITLPTLSPFSSSFEPFKSHHWNLAFSDDTLCHLNLGEEQLALFLYFPILLTDVMPSPSFWILCHLIMSSLDIIITSTVLAESALAFSWTFLVLYRSFQTSYW